MQVEDIQMAIIALSEEDFMRLRQWFAEQDWDRWNQQLASDIASGKLDALVHEALIAKQQGTLRELMLGEFSRGLQPPASGAPQNYTPPISLCYPDQRLSGVVY